MRLGWRGRVHDDGARCGIGMFIEDGAYTSVTAAVSMLLVLALVFTSATTVWRAARSGDVQVAADATALAGSNVVSSYYTVATTVDASILSLGMAGLMMAGAGLAGMLVPGGQAMAKETLDAAIRMLDMRNDFAASASRGLKTLEGSLPYLVAANGTRACAAHSSDRLTYTGTALAMPRTSESDFPAIEGEAIDTGGLQDAGEGLREVADKLERAREESSAAKEGAWLADCGAPEGNMQERAARLSGLSAAENPDYASSITWEPVVAIERARAYYAWRYANDRAEGQSVEEQADAAARHAFYGYAKERLNEAGYEERDGKVFFELELLPRNTSEVRRTTLYTDAVWPATMEGSGAVLHYAMSCPGATGADAGARSLAELDEGGVGRCPVCEFDVTDVGRAPAASTSIKNGFECHLRAFTLAMREYAAAREKELALEREALGEAHGAGDAFDEAISSIAKRRPRIAPPGRHGCVAFAIGSEATAPNGLSSTFAQTGGLAARGAVSASALAPEEATEDANVLGAFFSSIEERVGSGGAVGLIDGVMDLWGSLLVSYGDIGDRLSSLADELIGGLDTGGAGAAGRWLVERIVGLIEGIDMEPVDMRLRKPVLVDSARVLARSGYGGAADIQDLLRSIPAGASDPAAILRALRYEAGEYLLGMEFTLAEIPLPGGGSIPLVVKIRDVLGVLGPGRGRGADLP